MSSKTYGAIRTFVQQKLDLQEESFITLSEILTYTEEAIRFCEAEIHKLNIEDQYFLAQAPLALVSGKSDYDMPGNIYANKILRVVYSKGSDIFPVKRSRHSGRFENRENLRQYGASSSAWIWEYSLYNNDSRSGTKFRLYPTPSESSVVTSVTGDLTNGSAVVSNMSSTSGISIGDFVTGSSIPDGARVQSVDSATQVTLGSAAIATAVTEPLTFTEDRLIIWFIREAAVPTVTTDVIDVPEYWNFVAQYVLVECLKKELGNPRIQTEGPKLEQLRTQMLETLANMVPDQNDEIEKDMDFYFDMGLGEGL